MTTPKFLGTNASNRRPAIVAAGAAVGDRTVFLDGGLVSGQKIHLNGVPILSAGGVAPRAASWLSKWGFDVSFVSAIGQDDTGDMILAHLRQAGVDTEYIHRYKGRTSESWLVVEKSTRRERTAIMSLSPELQEQRLSKARIAAIVRLNDALVVDGAGNEADQRALALAFAKAGRPVVVNVECVESVTVDLLPIASVVVVSEQFIRGKYPHQTTVAALQRLAVSDRCMLLAATLGSRGSVALARTSSGWKALDTGVAAVEHLLDTTGAGDAWLAGITASFLKRLGWAESIRIATAASAFAVEAVGFPAAPRWRKLAERAARVPQEFKSTPTGVTGSTFKTAIHEDSKPRTVVPQKTSTVIAVVFDLDETLTGSPHIRAWRKALKIMGLKVPPHVWTEFAIRQRGVSNLDGASALQDLLGVSLDLERLVSLKKHAAIEMAASVPLYRDFCEALPDLHARFRLAVWTSSNREYWQTLCRRFPELASIPCATIETYVKSKPDPAGWFESLRLMGLKPQDAPRVAMVGDSIAKDLVGAKNGGCERRIHFLKRGRVAEPDNPKVVWATIHDHRDLLRLLSS